MTKNKHFNKEVFCNRMGGDQDAIISVLQFAVNNMKTKMLETKNFKKRIQIYRFAHFLRGTASNVSFDVCVEICNEILEITDSFKNENDQSITPEMKDKLNELEEAVTVTCKIIDIYISSKSG